MVKPGIIGMWQMSSRSETEYNESVLLARKGAY